MENENNETTNNRGNISYAKVTDSIRELVCDKYRNNISVKQISLELNVKYQTVVSIINVYKRTGRIRACKTHIGRPKGINVGHGNFLKALMQENCSITLKEMSRKLYENFNINPSISTINRACMGFNYSFKRISLISLRRNIESTIEARFEYASRFMNFDINKVIFIDEMGTSVSMRCAYGRSEVGTTPRKSVSSIRSKNFSVCCGITTTSVFRFKVKEGGYNGESYLHFLEDMCYQLESIDFSEAIIIADNVPFHKMNLMFECLQSKGHELVLLPPYSPQLNPIEEVFSKWNNLIKMSNPMNETTLLNAIRTSSEMITTTDIQGYVRHMREYLVKAVRREEF